MAQASAAFSSAQSFLNDVGGQIWNATNLLPFLQEAYRDLVLAITLNGLEVIKERSSAIHVIAGALTLTLPADFYEPIKLQERDWGSTNPDDYIDMVEQEWEEETQQDTILKYWTYRQQNINFIGATVDKDVLLYYLGGLALPTGSSSQLVFTLAEFFLGPQTAGYAAQSVGNDTLAMKLLYNPDSLNQGLAGGRLSQVVRINVKNSQGLPARRIPYRRAIRTKRFAF